MVILGVGVLLFLASLFVALFRRTQVPDVLLLIGLGLLLGPFTQTVTPDAFGRAGHALSTIALTVILFESGLTLRLDALRQSLGATLRMTVLGFAATTTPRGRARPPGARPAVDAGPGPRRHPGRHLVGGGRAHGQGAPARPPAGHRARARVRAHRRPHGRARRRAPRRARLRDDEPRLDRVGRRFLVRLRRAHRGALGPPAPLRHQPGAADAERHDRGDRVRPGDLRPRRGGRRQRRHRGPHPRLRARQPGRARPLAAAGLRGRGRARAPVRARGSSATSSSCSRRSSSSTWGSPCASRTGASAPWPSSR